MGPQAKRRKLTSTVEEINFDPVARHEFLTGFHKRKMARMRHAQEIAEKKAREERRQERKKIREERTAEFQRIMEENRKRMKELTGDSDSESGSDSGTDGEEEEWEGFAEPPAVDYEAEYVDEDKYTTVTVEEMDPSREGLYKAEKEDSDTEESSPDEEAAETAPASKKSATKTKAAGKTEKPKRKRKKFRYESKEERKLTRMKERLGKKKRAEARRQR
ncbi:hypothetical protein VTN02DRAFT_207 [Thermoascus thermophilus]